MAVYPRLALAVAVCFFAAIAVTPASAQSGLQYNIAFYTDNKCGTKSITGDAWIPDSCYPMVQYEALSSAATPGMLVSFGVKLKEDTPGKQVTISGYLSTHIGNYGACQAANTAFLAARAACSACSICDLTCSPGGSYLSNCCSDACKVCRTTSSAPSYDCNTAYRSGETCNDVMPSSSTCKGPGCTYGGVIPVAIVNGLPTDTCAATSDFTCQQAKICSVMIKTGISAGAIVGIIIGVLALIAMASTGYCFHRKSGPFAPGATWLGYLSSCGRAGAAQAPAAKTTEPAAAHNNAVLVIRATGADAGAPVAAAAAPAAAV